MRSLIIIEVEHGMNSDLFFLLAKTLVSRANEYLDSEGYDTIRIADHTVRVDAPTVGSIEDLLIGDPWRAGA